MSPPAVSVGVVGICSAARLTECLRALADQQDAPPFEVVVAHDPRIPGLEDLQERFPRVRFVANRDQRTPLELASRALSEARGEIILLTEDHCRPHPGWVRTLVDAQRPGRAAVGGTVTTDPDATAVEWAFYLVDFFRYLPPVEAGTAPSLTVCNVSYRREHLEAIHHLWEDFFHETMVNEALRSRFGPLWIQPDARVRMRRRVGFREAIRERYAFGRLFGATRCRFVSTGRRVLYSLLAPLLPILLLGRMARKVLRSPGTGARFARALPVLVALVAAWSLGEWLGYVTGRRPDVLLAAEAARDLEDRT